MSRGLINRTLQKIIDCISSNTFGAEVDIYSSATSSSGYTAPSDGYVTFQNYNSASGRDMSLSINGVEMMYLYSTYFASYSKTSLFVKKGMVIKFRTSFSALQLHFVPLST